MALRIEKNIVRLDIPMDDALLMNVAERAGQLGHPEPDGLFSQGFSGYVKPQIATVH